MKKFLSLLVFAALLAVTAFPQSDPGYGRYRNTALSSTPQAIKVSMSNVYGYTFINSNTTAVYVKLYNKSSGGTVVGTTVPQAVIMVPPGDGTTPGLCYLAPIVDSPWEFFSTAATVAVVTGLADNSTAAPSTGIYVEVYYK